MVVVFGWSNYSTLKYSIHDSIQEFRDVYKFANFQAPLYIEVPQRSSIKTILLVWVTHSPNSPNSDASLYSTSRMWCNRVIRPLLALVSVSFSKELILNPSAFPVWLPWKRKHYSCLYILWSYDPNLLIIQLHLSFHFNYVTGLTAFGKCTYIVEEVSYSKD